MTKPVTTHILADAFTLHTTDPDEDYVGPLEVLITCDHLVTNISACNLLAVLYPDKSFGSITTKEI